MLIVIELCLAVFMTSFWGWKAALCGFVWSLLTALAYEISK